MLVARTLLFGSARLVSVRHGQGLALLGLRAHHDGISWGGLICCIVRPIGPRPNPFPLRLRSLSLVCSPIDPRDQGAQKQDHDAEWKTSHVDKDTIFAPVYLERLDHGAARQSCKQRHDTYRWRHMATQSVRRKSEQVKNIDANQEEKMIC